MVLNKGESAAKKYTAVIVDDEHFNIELLARVLKKDYIVESFISGDEAFAALSKGLKPDIILSDQRMPGMTGVELLQKAGMLYPDSVRIIISGYTDQADLLSAINSGCVHQYVTKPWKVEELNLVLQKELTAYEEKLQQKRAGRIRLRALLATLALCVLALILSITRAPEIVETKPAEPKQWIGPDKANRVERDWIQLVPEAAMGAENPFAPTEDSIYKGALAYHELCIACHGAKGLGDGVVSKLFNLPTKKLHNDGALNLAPGIIHWVVVNGIPGSAMKPLAEMVPHADRWHVINYLQAMAEGREIEIEEEEEADEEESGGDDASETAEIDE